MSFLSQPITLQGLFGTKRVIGPIQVQVIISEETQDTLTITKQPVQTGSPITDHSFLEPTTLQMRILQQNNNFISGLQATFSGGGLGAIYKTFLDLQKTLQPFTVITPKRIYQNMLIASLRCSTDKTTENILALDVGLQQIILVNIGTTQIAIGNQGNPAVTQATQNLGQQQSIFSKIASFVGFQ
jgi:hypothetical protein